MKTTWIFCGTGDKRRSSSHGGVTDECICDVCVCIQNIHVGVLSMYEAWQVTWSVCHLCVLVSCVEIFKYNLMVITKYRT